MADGAGPSNPLLDAALALMEQRQGRIEVAEVAKRCGVTTRHLARVFSDVVGLPPKFYARVLQINQVLEILFMGGNDSLAGVASDGGYYDQAHLNRAMKMFLSEGPSAFLKSDHLLLRTFLEHEDTAGRSPGKV